MAPGAEQLVVRQHERFHCRLPLRLRIAADVVEQVILARAVSDGSGAIDAFITDASRGGLGIESAVFLPRGCRLRVRLKSAGPTPTPDNDLIVRVQRVSMLDRKPTYYLGVSFFSKGPEHDQTIAAMLDAARQGQHAIAPGKGGG